MLQVWNAPLARATKGIDFLGRLDNSLENLERITMQIDVGFGVIVEPIEDDAT